MKVLSADFCPIVLNTSTNIDGLIGYINVNSQQGVEELVVGH
jgi:hypothetical protein